MAMELVTTERPAQVTKQLNAKGSLTSGETLKMELGEDELDVTVPEGETWTFTVQLLVDVE